MPAKSPEEICEFFKTYMAQGDLDSLVGIYDPEAAFLDQSGEIRRGRDGMREVLAPLADARARFDFKIRQVIQSGEIALMHTEWTVSSSEGMSSYAIEVARRQPDGSWCWLIGDPFTVGKHSGSKTEVPTRS